jgi:hypothetical protein
MIGTRESVSDRYRQSGELPGVHFLLEVMCDGRGSHDWCVNLSEQRPGGGSPHKRHFFSEAQPA